MLSKLSFELLPRSPILLGRGVLDEVVGPSSGSTVSHIRKDEEDLLVVLVEKVIVDTDIDSIRSPKAFEILRVSVKIVG